MSYFLLPNNSPKWIFLVVFQKNNINFLSMIKWIACLIAALACLISIDRYFFKCNASFSIRFIYTCNPDRAEWDLPTSNEQIQTLDDIVSQEFTYLGKGAHCFAFESKDKKYILKFHRFPSHMRPFPWLNRPFAYLFNKKRIEIKEYNWQRYHYFMENYKNGFEDLREEAGLILVHINRTEHLKKKVTLIDKTGNRYLVWLDKIPFILQHKANLVYPTLNEYLRRNQREQAKQTITHILELIVRSCKKGYLNKDPILKRNFGLLNDRAICIDFGDVVKSQEMKQPEKYVPYLMQTTADLRDWAAQHHPELLEHYEREVHRLRDCR